MTKEEAIAYGNDYYKDLISACCKIDEKHKEFVRMSLEALEQEPCDDCCNGKQIEKAKLCQKSYIAGMEHKQEPLTDVLDRIMAEIDREYKWLMNTRYTIHDVNIAFGYILGIIDKYKNEMLK